MATTAQPAAKSIPLVQRMFGAAKLNVHTFEKLEADPKATTQAMLVVIIVSLCSAIGPLLGSFIVGGNPIRGIVLGLVWGVAGWAVWALVTFILGTTLFKTEKTHASWGELARTTGFAQSPGVFKALAFLPAVGPLIFFLASIWQLAAMVVAVRQALDYESTWRAVGVVVVGFLIIYVPLLIIMGGPMLGRMSR